MNHSLLWALVLALTAPAVAETEQGPAENPALALMPVGPVDPALAERVRAFAQENLALPVRLLPPREAAPAESLNELGESVRDARGEKEVCLVVLAMPLENIPNHGVLLPESDIAVVNVKALRPADDDAEQYGRRVERGVMMGLGLLLGLESCPNPECAMWLYTNDEELDAKGRNYCPPCLMRAQKLAAEKGLSFITDSPFAPVLEDRGEGESPSEEPLAEESPAAEEAPMTGPEMTPSENP